MPLAPLSSTQAILDAEADPEALVSFPAILVVDNVETFLTEWARATTGKKRAIFYVRTMRGALRGEEDVHIKVTIERLEER